MKVYKKLLAVLLACMLSLSLLTACGGGGGGSNSSSSTVDMAIMKQLGASDSIQENSALDRLAALELEMQPKLLQLAFTGTDEEKAAFEEELLQKEMAILKDLPSGMEVLYEDSTISGIGTSREEAIADLIEEYANSTAVTEAKYCGMAEGTVTMFGMDEYEIIVILAK